DLGELCRPGEPFTLRRHRQNQNTPPASTMITPMSTHGTAQKLALAEVALTPASTVPCGTIGVRVTFAFIQISGSTPCSRTVSSPAPPGSSSGIGAGLADAVLPNNPSISTFCDVPRLTLPRLWTR